MPGVGLIRSKLRPSRWLSPKSKQSFTKRRLLITASSKSFSARCANSVSKSSSDRHRESANAPVANIPKVPYLSAIPPEAFMRANPINIVENSELAGAVDEALPGGNRQVKVMPGVHEFDLEVCQFERGNRFKQGGINLRRFGDRAKGAGDLKSNRIRAYWLPWRAAGESHIQLGNEADYFFTSALGGCRIQIGAGPNPLVMHISGQLTPQQRDQ